MARSLYMVCPAPERPTFFGTDALAASGAAGAVFAPDLAALQVASMAQASGLHVTLCDEAVTPVDLDHPADYVALSAKSYHRRRMRALASDFRRRGRTVVIGGPYATTSPDEVRPHCDVLVRGEIEEIAPQLFSDLASGAPRSEYVGSRPESIDGVPPDWSLYPVERAISAVLQTSRGCPFECDFCDVVQYLGRRQRFKSVPAILAELDRIHAAGFRRVFVVDDNFTAHRSRCMEVLDAIERWNARQDEGIVFGTQVSLDAARDDALLERLAAAGANMVFVGIETPDPDCLREVNKRPSLGAPILESVAAFLRHGLQVASGMIVGFDHDTPATFDRLFRFAQGSCIPIFTLGALVALPGTPLHARVKRAGRLIPDAEGVAGSPWSTNIDPLRMSRSELLEGVEDLARRLYDPESFAERVLGFVDRLEPGPPSPWLPRRMRSVEVDVFTLLSQFELGAAGAHPALSRIVAAVERKPEATRAVGSVLYSFLQARHLIEHHRSDRVALDGRPGGGP